MDNDIHKLFIACIKSGLIPPLFAPIMMPFLVFIVEGNFPSLSTYPSALIYITLTALIFGVLSCITIGFPALLIMEKLNANKPIFVSIVGFVAAVLIFFIFGPSNNQIPISQSWPGYLFFGVLGAICGFTASYLSRPNKALQPTAERGG